MESNDEKDALLRQRRGGEDGKGELVVVSEPVGVEEENIYLVTIPLGVRPGEMFLIEARQQYFSVRVAPGGRPGMTMRVQVNASDAVQAIPVDENSVYPEASVVSAPPLRPRDGKWRDGILGCCNNLVPSLCLACSCWCFPYARIRNKEMLDEPSVLGWPGWQYWGNLFLTFCLWLAVVAGNIYFNQTMGVLLFVASLCFFYIIYRTRAEFRRRNQITQIECSDCCGAELEDCCCSFFCPCLVLAQMDRHAFGRTKICECYRIGEAFGPPREGEHAI